jgi:hypothetical protein
MSILVPRSMGPTGSMANPLNVSNYQDVAADRRVKNGLAECETKILSWNWIKGPFAMLQIRAVHTLFLTVNHSYQIQNT